MTASELYEILKPVMGKGILPEWLTYHEYLQSGLPGWFNLHDERNRASSCPDAAACMIAEAAMVRWLRTVGQSLVICYPERDLPQFRIHASREIGRGDTLTAALVAACVAVREGE